ncbi:hypothetical protein HY346_01220 [Candidatus Microgenomates bacterium]|nr:hypothetical protein [Candidatus Microgenomates bacterium]
MPRPEELPEPLWRGFMVGADEVYTRVRSQGMKRDRLERLDSLEQSVIDDEERLRDYRRTIQEISTRLSANRAELRALREAAAQIEVDQAMIERDIALIRQLPGFLGLRVEAGRLKLHIRTHYEVEDHWYDAGDFEITIWPRGRGERTDHREALFAVTSTRLPQVAAGNRCGIPGCYEHRARGRGYGHLYFHFDYVGDGGATTGWFCFGARIEQINGLIQSGEFAQALSLMVASMNAFNDGEEAYVSGNYREVPKPTPERRARLRPRQRR